MRLPVILCLAASFAPLAVASDFIVNGSFETSADGWTIARSSDQAIVFWTSAFGTPPRQDGTSGGSLNLTALANSSISASQCVAIGAGRIDASVLVFPFVTAGPASAQVAAFAGQGCTGVALGAVALLPRQAVVAGGWIVFDAAEQALPPGTQSARFALAAADGDNASSGDYLFDDARLQSTSVFADGFELDAAAPAD